MCNLNEAIMANLIIFKRTIAILLFVILQIAGGILTAQDSSKTEGFNCLFMGHSFFAPIVKNLPGFAEQAGIESHKQMVVYHSGRTGAPGIIWKNEKNEVKEAKEYLKSGNVDVLGLTFYPTTGSEVSDYSKWIDLGLKNNSNFIVIIQSPWAIKKENEFSEYEIETRKWHERIHELIAKLREKYPRIKINCLPQGIWMIELWKLYNEGKLPELKEFVAENKKKSEHALFADEFGHGGTLAVKYGALLWLSEIYNLDLSKCAIETNTGADLKSLAKKILVDDKMSGIK